MIHLVCGPIGAGKTTYAHEIALKHNAIRFSEDEWLSKLFVPDAPEGLLSEPMQVVGAWASEKYQRCRGQIWVISQQLLSQNISIVLDDNSIVFTLDGTGNKDFSPEDIKRINSKIM